MKAINEEESQKKTKNRKQEEPNLIQLFTLMSNFVKYHQFEINLIHKPQYEKKADNTKINGNIEISNLELHIASKQESFFGMGILVITNLQGKEVGKSFSIIQSY